MKAISAALFQSALPIPQGASSSQCPNVLDKHSKTSWQKAHIRAHTARDSIVMTMFADKVVAAMLRAAAGVPVNGAVTPVDSFSPLLLKAVLSLVLSASPEPSVDFMVVTAAASLARILGWTTTLELGAVPLEEAEHLFACGEIVGRCHSRHLWPTGPSHRPDGCHTSG